MNTTVTEPTSLGVDINKTIGPALIGVLINWAGLGMLVHQVHSYATYYHHKDQFFIKWLVYVVLAGEMASTFFLTHFVYGLTIISWGKLQGLAVPPWSSKLIVACNSYIPIIVQSFFAWRIWTFNRQSHLAKVATVVVWVLALAQAGICTTYLVKLSQLLSGNVLYAVALQERQIRALATWWHITSAVTNVINAAAMVVSLRLSKHQPGRVATTIAILDQLILMAVEAGVVTTIVTVISLILFVHPKTKDTLLYLAPVLCVGKFYSTMFLANLNGRRKLEVSQNKALSMTANSSGIEMQPAPFGTTRSRFGQANILVSTTVESYPDGLEGKFGGVEKNGTKL